jgi:hypothetical protein
LGWEVDLCALSGDCDLQRLARDYDVPIQRFQFIPYYFRLRRQSKDKAEAFVRDDPCFATCIEDMIAHNVGIEFRYCELDRRADWLKWLLQRCTAGTDSQFAKIAIEGESIVAPEARSSQGFPLRRNSPDTCGFVCEWLKGITEKQLYREYDPEMMEQAGLYKWRVPQDPLLTYERILRDFRNLREFYHRVSESEEAAFVTID